MRIIGHRGASFYSPENTLSSFRLALEQGADGFELDVRLTLDGEIIAMHDDTTLRTCGQDYDVARTPYGMICPLSAGGCRDREPVPRLADALDVLPDDKQIYIEIKCGAEIIDPLKKIMSDYSRLRENIVLFGFGYETIRSVKNVMPHHKVLWIGEFGCNIGIDSFQQAEDMVRVAGLDGFSTASDKRCVREMRRRLDNKLLNV